MIHVTCRLTAKNLDQLRNPTLGNRVWATFFSFIGNYALNMFTVQPRIQIAHATGYEFQEIFSWVTIYRNCIRLLVHICAETL